MELVKIVINTQEDKEMVKCVLLIIVMTDKRSSKMEHAKLVMNIPKYL